MTHLAIVAATFAGQEVSTGIWWTLSIWVFATGAAIGSFMNVVVYRMPAGLSVVHPNSFCPSCKHPIRWRHNLPIVGWFILRGRCYDCGARFSARYALVEAIVAVLFLTLCQVEVFSNGANLPRFVATPEVSSLGTLWAIYGYHLLLCCALLCVALIEFDGHSIPQRLWIPVVICGLLLPLLAPDLNQVLYTWPFAVQPTNNTTSSVALSGLCGLACGVVLAWPPAALARLPLPTASAVRAGLLLVGAFLGWQAALLLATATMIVYLIAVVLNRFVCSCFGRIPWSGILFTLTFALIVFAKPLVELASIHH